MTASWWYERQRRPHGPSVFFEEVAALEAVENLVTAEQPDESPLMAELQARAVWPPVVRNLFESLRPSRTGRWMRWRTCLQAGAPDELLGALDAGERAAAERMLADHRHTIAALGAGVRGGGR